MNTRFFNVGLFIIFVLVSVVIFVPRFRYYYKGENAIELMKKGDYQKAYNLFLELNDMAEEGGNNELLMAECSFHFEDYKKATHHLTNYLKVHEYSSNAREFRIELNCMLGKQEEVISDCEFMISIFPDKKREYQKLISSVVSGISCQLDQSHSSSD